MYNIISEKRISDLRSYSVYSLGQIPYRLLNKQESAHFPQFGVQNKQQT